jgi:hypothetical protein
MVYKDIGGKMIKEKTWEEFRETGLLLIINQILHIFGWVICFEVDKSDDDIKIIRAYPARTKYRGFQDKAINESYLKISKYMKNNSDELLKEVLED